MREGWAGVRHGSVAFEQFLMVVEKAATKWQTKREARENSSASIRRGISMSMARCG